jgi:hypothetical protein
MPVSTLARVDLPQPDSPTIARVWPRLAVEVDVVDRVHIVSGAAEHAGGLVIGLAQVRDLQHRSGVDRRLAERDRLEPGGSFSCAAARGAARTSRGAGGSCRRTGSGSWLQRSGARELAARRNTQPLGRLRIEGTWPGSRSAAAVLVGAEVGMQLNSPRV